jgi:outer membrane protein OmpA-like peptidoglycan-associated protein
MAMGQAQAARQQAQLEQQQTQQLKKQLSELKAQQTNRGNVMLTVPDVMFATNQATLAPGAMLAIDKPGDILKQNPNEKVYIEGHTDNTGSAQYNQQLSTARANAVREALIQQGVSPDRITAQGLGESFPVATNETQAGRQMNRRVDIVITGGARAMSGAKQ